MKYYLLVEVIKYLSEEAQNIKSIKRIENKSAYEEITLDEEPLEEEFKDEVVEEEEEGEDFVIDRTLYKEEGEMEDIDFDDEDDNNEEGAFE